MGVEESPDRRRRRDKKKQREERRWARKSGPVTVRQATPEELAELEARRRARRAGTDRV